MRMSSKQFFHESLSRRELLRRGLYGGLAVGLGPSLWVSGCAGGKRGKDEFNVIFISIDTLRWDHIGCYGYERNTTANIDAFAAENILFENCYVHEPTTAPSHMSMFTGLYPFTHGVNRFSSLDESITTLAEVLRAEGYRTVGFVRDCGQMRPVFGFDRGFDKYYEKSHREFIAELQNKFMAKHLKKYKDKKVFAFIHYYDVHSDFDKLPYDSPEPYDRMYYPNYSGDFTGGDGKLFASEYLVHVNQDRVGFKEDDLEYITALYDGGVTYTDKYLGELFGILKELGLYETSVIIVTSDHGEEFQEHGWMLHSNPHYYEELVRVPLIMKLPGTPGKGKVVTRPVESIDFMPTILGMVGVKNVPMMHGDNFMRIIEDPEAEWKDTVFGYSVAKGPRAFVRTERWKLITRNLDGMQDFKLFDLECDQLEKLDVAGNADGVTERLKAKLIDRYAKLKRPGKQKTVPMTVEERERLRSLGYVE
jgi:choline-sulfatase